jgi:Protein kinase domain
VPTDATEAPTTFALRAGAVIADRFRIVRPLAGGSAYAITYLADDLTRGEPIVIKEFFPRGMVTRAPDGLTAHPHSPESGRDFVRALRRFVIEGSVLSEVAHPHVVRVRGLVEANGTAYLVMDQHHSQPLAEYLRVHGGRLPAAVAGRIVQHLLTALEPLHAESVVHRDVSPRSVHVQGDGSVLLLEFSARRHLPLHATDLAAGFAAFEQYGMRDIGPWTDVYAASAVLYYLLTGVVPPSALDRAAGEALQSPTALVPNLSQGLARLVLRGMSLLPQQRPHVASELRRQLEASLTDSAQPPRNAPSQFGADALSTFSEGATLDNDGRVGNLKLAAGGIVLPGEERNGGLLGRLGSAAARFRRATNPMSAPAAVHEEAFAPAPATHEAPHQPTPARAPIPRQTPTPAPVAALEPFEAPASLVASPLTTERELVDAPRPAPATSLMAIEERALPTSTDDRMRALDLAAQLSLVNEEIEASFDARTRRSRYNFAAAAALVITVAGSLAFLVRNGRASSSTQFEAKLAAPGGVTPAVVTPSRTGTSATHDVMEAGAVVPRATRVDSSATRPVATAEKPHVSAPVEHRASPPPAPEPKSQIVLPSGKLPSVNVAISGPATDLKLVSPEMLVDARMRLTNGQDAVEQGDYVLARRTFRGALQQVDSLVGRYPDSDKIRTLRRDLEQADTRALQACTAENDMRKRRGEQGKACQ